MVEIHFPVKHVSGVETLNPAFVRSFVRPVFMWFREFAAIFTLARTVLLSMISVAQ